MKTTSFLRLSLSVPFANIRMGKSISILLVLLACSMASGQQQQKKATTPPPMPKIDVELTLPADKERESFTIDRPAAGKTALLVRGLKKGGAVTFTLNGKSVPADLLASEGLKAGKADKALIVTDLPVGKSELTVVESDGVQIVREEKSLLYFGVNSDAAGNALFSVDLASMCPKSNEMPLTVYYGRDYKPFYLTNGGKLEVYVGTVYAESAQSICTASGPQEASLKFELGCSQPELSYSVTLTLGRGGGQDVVPLRVRQNIRKTGPKPLNWNMQFLHLILNPGPDWEDGVPDWLWHRMQVEDAPDTLVGSHTHYERINDDTVRVFNYRISSENPDLQAVSAAHHTSAIMNPGAVNSIGGWFSKQGVGSIGLVWHRYSASWRHLYPTFGNCGDGGDTHFYTHWADMYGPLKMDKAGDTLDIEYTLFCLPSETTYSDVDDLNELDLIFFGKERQQTSQIVAFVGAKEVIGLLRSDHSLVLYNVSNQDTTFAVPLASRQTAKRVYHMWDPGRPIYRPVEIIDGKVSVPRRAYTIVDCGSALIVPSRYTPPPSFGLDKIKDTFYVDLTPVATRPMNYFWRGSPRPNRGHVDSLGGITDFPGEVLLGGVKFRIADWPKGLLALEGPAPAKAATPPATQPGAEAATQPAAPALPWYVESPPLMTWASHVGPPPRWPSQAQIPVGKAADAMLFVHSLIEGKSFKYVLRYGDGKDVTLNVEAGKNIARFRAPVVWEFPPQGTLRATLVSAFRSQYTGHGCAYRMEYLAPADRRSVAIRAIDVMVEEPDATPIVFAVSGILLK